ncbi:MAG: cryptochrome/photolyase family protein [Bacteroidia bacterium]
MPKTASIVFPHQLFKEHPVLQKNTPVYLIEDSLFFGDKQYPARFHQQKLVLHRASMKLFARNLESKGYEVHYLSYIDDLGKKPAGFWLTFLAEKGIEKIRFCDPVDCMLEKRIRRAAGKHGLQLDMLESPNFINSRKENERLFSESKRYFMADFYKYQRKKLGILLEEDGENPLGGQWSFDEENRKKLPKKLIDQLPEMPWPERLEVVEEAILYVKKHFSENPGQAVDFRYPVNHEQAEAWLEDFLQQRFANFGPFEDAIEEGKPFLYHSLLTPMLNIGLLSPMQVVDRALAFAEDNEVPLPSLEGFVRQIIGWREYMRATYVQEGVRMRNGNHWKHHRRMPEDFYTGETGIPPIDDAIKRTLSFAYTHHIERLMVLGGFMFLCRIDPKAIYTWFMELFIDAYDWVMVPNVYAMSQNSAGGIITTKPYFSGSNYVRKMSHYTTGDWCDTWDGLYWNFIFDHSEALEKHPRWAMMVSMGKRMDEAKRQQHIQAAERFLEKIS